VHVRDGGGQQYELACFDELDLAAVDGGDAATRGVAQDLVVSGAMRQ
jgi:hypothetical protein